MTNLLFFVIGFVLAIVLMEKPIKIDLHHTYKTEYSELPDVDMSALEEKMLKEDPKVDRLYEDFDKTLQEVNEIMGGSDR